MYGLSLFTPPHCAAIEKENRKQCILSGAVNSQIKIIESSTLQLLPHCSFYEKQQQQHGGEYERREINENKKT
jgi:predicted GNAT family acetyltransferase